MHPSSCRFVCGLLVYAAAVVNMFALATEHLGYAVVGVAILAVGAVGGKSVWRASGHPIEVEEAEHAAR